MKEAEAFLSAVKMCLHYSSHCISNRLMRRGLRSQLKEMVSDINQREVYVSPAQRTAAKAKKVAVCKTCSFGSTNDP